MTFQKWNGGEQLPSWKPEKGDHLEGVFTEVRENVGPNNSSIYTVEQKGGEKIVVWGNAILNNFFTHIPKGSMVKMKYLGRTKNPATGREFHNYELEHDPETANQEELAKTEFGIE